MRAIGGAELAGHVACVRASERAPAELVEPLTTGTLATPGIHRDV